MGLFKPKVPKVEPPPNPLPMPDIEDPAIIEARRKKLDDLYRSGRQSTVLTGPDAYTSDKLGLR